MLPCLLFVPQGYHVNVQKKLVDGVRIDFAEM